MKKYIFLATALAALVSCSENEFVGDENITNTSQNEQGAIAFGSFFKAVTRGDTYGAAAADLLGNKFIVTGVKGDGTGTGQTDVFKSYNVEWTANTAGKTESNTADWEYVGKTNTHNTVNSQTIKYWDYSTTAYDFAAYSVGKGITLTPKTTSTISSGDAPASGTIFATPITYSATQIAESAPATYEITNAYMLRGVAADLAKCYITDMKTVANSAYQQEVELQFRSLATKVRMAIYETVPGYSIKEVEFFHSDAVARNTNISSNTSATLFGDDVFYTSGTYTISFPHIGSGNSSDPDYNKAHVTMSGVTDGDAGDIQSFGALNYTSAEGDESGGSIYLGRSSSAPSFAGTDTWYQTMLPNENGVVLEMRVNYTLVSTDGSGEAIKVYGAKAFVPAVYTKWLPNYAYTYIFKISDNTNGWTNPSGNDDKAGLFPITFDAVVLSNEETGHQTTITTVAKPSITTYQKGHVYSASDEYKKSVSPNATAAASNDAIYAQVMNDGVLVTNLNTAGNSYFYKLSETAGKNYTSEPSDWPTGYYTDDACLTAAPTTFAAGTYYKKGPWSEANVMDALNIQESATSGTIKGRNGITLTEATADYTVTQIPGEDGNWITKYNNAGTPTAIAAGMVAKLSPTVAGTYAYVYKVSTGSSTEFNTAVVTTEAPSDWVASDANVYYSDFACTTKVTTAWEAGTYYKKYTNLNNVYGVKVIKVVD